MSAPAPCASTRHESAPSGRLSSPETSRRAPSNINGIRMRVSMGGTACTELPYAGRGVVGCTRWRPMRRRFRSHLPLVDRRRNDTTTPRFRPLPRSTGCSDSVSESAHVACKRGLKTPHRRAARTPLLHLEGKRRKLEAARRRSQNAGSRNTAAIHSSGGRRVILPSGHYEEGLVPTGLRAPGRMGIVLLSQPACAALHCHVGQPGEV